MSKVGRRAHFFFKADVVVDHTGAAYFLIILPNLQEFKGFKF